MLCEYTEAFKDYSLVPKRLTNAVLGCCNHFVLSIDLSMPSLHKESTDSLIIQA